MVRLSSGLAALAAVTLGASSVVADLAAPSPSQQRLVKRQQASGTRTRSSGAAATQAPAAGGQGSGSGAGAGNNQGGLSGFTGTLPQSVLSIVATITSGVDNPNNYPTLALPTTATPGQTNSYVSGAPPLPAATINPTVYPALDQLVPENSPLIQQWMQKIDFSKVPNIPQNPSTFTCGDTTNPNVGNAQKNGWWTCGGYTRSTDITTCQNPNTWGVSYDDGPSPYTPMLLDYFSKNNIKSTFFIVGSRAISRPDMLQAEYVSGHQLSVHTWSHPYLTTLSNAQIVGQLAWTMKAIKDITGVTPNTMRPPYGDIDDRVRAICQQMGLTPIIWTTAPGPNGMTFDTNDWRIGAGQVSAANAAYTFEQIIRTAPSLSTGYIVLSHDLYSQSVELSLEVILPFVAQFTPKQTLLPIINCVGQPMNNAYIETNSNTSNSNPASTISGSVPTGTGYSTTPSSSSSQKGAAAAHASVAGGALALAAAAVGAALAL